MRKSLICAVACMAAALLLAPAALAVDKVNTQKLRKGVTTAGILEHMGAFQEIADANSVNRAATTSGYDDSLDYVEERLDDAGYDTTRHRFDFARWTQQPGALLQRTGQTAYTEGTDYVVAQFSGSGDVTAQVVTTNDIELTPTGDPGSGTSGCEQADWTGQDLTGKIALVERGTCPFVQKINIAKGLGAAAVLIFNDGYPTRTDPFQIGAPPFIGIPVAMTSFAVGSELYNAIQAGQTELRIVVNATTEAVPQFNLIADSAGRTDRTIVVGAHLDSVEEGPGINDNGSGSSTLIEMAEEIAELPHNPRNRIRFAFWGAEEAGLIGSAEYVADLVESGDIDEIEANLNFDMLSSPNFVRFVYDGDLSDTAGTDVPGSGEIERVFLDYFASRGLATEPTAFDGRSDYGPFIANGVPAGGLFSGAEGVKTDEQAEIYGGAAGSWYDPCYHQPCDNLDTILGIPPFGEAAGLESAEDAELMRANGPVGLGQLADGAAHATWTLARSRSALRSAAVAKKATSAKAKRATKRRLKRMTHRGHLAVR